MIKLIQSIIPMPQKNVLRLVKALVFVALFFYADSSFAQADATIYTLSGGAIKCKVQDIGEDSVTYNEASDLNGKALMMSKKEISIVKYIKGNYIEAINIDQIFTADGKLVYGKITGMDADNKSINYMVPGAAAAEKMAVTGIKFVKYADGKKVNYNVAGIKPSAGVAILPQKVEEEDAQKTNSTSSILQNWKRKYTTPPIEVL
jgi:hypothetical protein